MADAVVLAIDVGTTSVRSTLVDAEGELCGSARRETDDPSGMEFDPEALWANLVAAIGDLDAGHRRGVRCLVIAGHLGSVFVDARHVPVGVARGWGDTNGVERVEQVLRHEKRAILRTTGRPSFTGGALAASLELLASDPVAAASVATVLSPKDFLNARLCGVLATDPVSAAYTGASDIEARAWSAGIISAVGLDPGWLPRQLPATDALGALLPDVAVLLGLDPGTQVLVGAPDGTTGASYLLAAHPGSIADVAGTTDVLAVRAVARPSSDRVVVNPYLFGAGFTAGGPTGLTGGAISHWRQRWGAPPETEEAGLRRALVGIEPGADGLLMGTSFTGSRFPRWNPSDRGWLRGETERHGRAHVLRAALEGAAFAVREGLDVLDPECITPVALAGGVARSPEAVQLRADVFGRQVRASTDVDVTIRGAALIGLIGLGLWEPDRAPDDSFVEYQPDPARVSRYRELFELWREGYQA